MGNKQIKKPQIYKNIFKLHWLLIAIFIYSVAIAFGNFFIIKPQLKTYKDLRVKKENLDNIYLKIRSIDIERALNNLNAKLEKCQSLEKSFESHIVEKKHLSVVLSELNWIVEKSGLKLNSIDPMHEAGKILGKFRKQPISIRFQGSYPNFLSFLNNLEQSRYWLLIDSYSISHRSKDISNHTYNIVIFTIVS